MNNKFIYFSLDQSVVCNSKRVCIEDIATIHSTDKTLENEVKHIFITNFNDSEEDLVVITSMKLIELITNNIADVICISEGCPETIVYYKNIQKKTRVFTIIKAIFLVILAFFGAAYSIMSYNCDVAMARLLDNIYELFQSTPAPDIHAGYICYSIGLFLGIMFFYNHGIFHKYNDDPTPLEIEMRLYETDVNSTIITDMRRNNKTIDKE